MAFRAAERITLAGLTPTMHAATATTGDTFTPGPDIFLFIRNGGGAPTNATLDVPGSTPVGEAQPDPIRAITNGTDKFIGPFDTQIFTDPATGLAKFTCAPVTSVTFAVLQF